MQDFWEKLGGQMKQPSNVADPNNSHLNNESLLLSVLKWLVLPVAGYLVMEAGFSVFIPEHADADVNLLIFQIAILVLVVGVVVFARLNQFVLWTLPKSWAWLWIAGPLWLGVFTPIPCGDRVFSKLSRETSIVFCERFNHWCE